MDSVPGIEWVPLIIMPLAFILLVKSLTTPNPAMAGGDRAFESGTTAIGIMAITRHPLFWSIALSGISHLLARGNLATIWMAGGMTVLGLAGTSLQDRKKMQIKGALWGHYTMRTSAMPFVAAIQRRTAIDRKGIGLWRPALGIALHVIFLGDHRHIFGVGPIPL